MPLRITTTAYGAEAVDELSARIDARRGPDPLAPVTVVVPSNPAGLFTRRSLVGRRGALAGVSFVTLWRLAQLLGAEPLERAGRVPLSNAVVAAAVRATLREDPGPFEAVARHAATTTALVRAFTELRAVPDGVLAELARSDRPGAETVRLLVGVRARLPDRYDERDLLASARRTLLAGEVRPDPTVLHLPQQLSPAAAELLAVLAERSSLDVVVGLTGDPAADRRVVEAVGRLGVRPERTGSIGRPRPARVITATDADEEVRAAVRVVAETIDGGVAADRIGLFFPTAVPYARIVHEQLVGAGLPHHGPAVERLSASVPGRLLRRLLALGADSGRAEVAALLAAAPLHGPDGRPVPAARWDRLSRRAGVVGGRVAWDRRLSRWAEQRRERPEHEDPDDTESQARRRADADEAEQLRDFVLHVLDSLAAAESTWASRSQAAIGLVERLLPAAAALGWPEAEQDARDQVLGVLARLGRLDAVDPQPTATRFREAVDDELDVAGARLGVFGHGVAVGPVSAAAGADLDLVVLVGAAEGVATAVPEDPLLPPELRERAGGHLDVRSVEDRIRSHLVALAAAPERVVVVPRGDHRRGRTMVAARFVRSDVEEGRTSVLEIPSHPAGVRDRPAASEADLRLQALSRSADAGADLAEHPFVTGALAAGLALRRARRGDDLGRFEGLVGAGLVSSPVGTDAISPTSLELLGSCPRRWLLERHFRLGDEDDPEEILDLSPLDRGSLLHAVLEDLTVEVIEGGGIEPGAPWSDEHHQRAEELLAVRAQRFEELGLTGRPLLWKDRRRRLLRDLAGHLRHDSQERALSASTPVAAEHDFGEEPVELRLDDGRVIRFRGRVDRVDRTATGGAVVVDFKTGRPFRALDERDPTASGTKYQLPVYALAGRRLLGTDEVTALYRFFPRDTQQGSDVALPLTPEVESRVRFEVGALVDTIEAGAFPAHPGPASEWPRAGSHENCRYCDFDRICPPDRGGRWERTRDAPALRPYLRVIREAPGEDEDDEGSAS